MRNIFSACFVSVVHHLNNTDYLSIVTGTHLLITAFSRITHRVTKLTSLEHVSIDHSKNVLCSYPPSGLVEFACFLSACVDSLCVLCKA